MDSSTNPATEEYRIPDNCRLVYSNQQITSALDRLAEKLNQQLAGETPLVLCVMQGGLVFAGQLIPKLQFMLEIDYIHASRYANETSGGELIWKTYPHSSLADRTVLILDDILDEGNTMQAIIQYCQSQGASNIVSAVLLKKNHDRYIDDHSINSTLTDNIALSVEDDYVFGFGMDYNGQYRQLDAIYALIEEE